MKKLSNFTISLPVFQFYLQSLLEICRKIPDCPLNTTQNKFISKQVLCDFDPFFRKGLFENTKYGTS